MEKYLVYENWHVRPKKAMVHKETCKKLKDGHERIEDRSLETNPSENDRWFGKFSSLSEAAAFASLLPNRQLKLCSFCLNQEKNNI